MKQRKPYKPTIEVVKKLKKSVQRRSPAIPSYVVERSTGLLKRHWSEYPPHSGERSLAREYAADQEDVNERCRAVLWRAPDQLLDYDGDFQVPPGLSRHEQVILVMIAHGNTSQEIAVSLHLAPNTIHKYRARLGRKFDCSLNQRNARKIVRLPPRQRRPPPQPRQDASDPEMLPLDLDFSGREIDVAVGVDFGYSSKEIAAVLGLSVRTIYGYRRSLRRKLGIPRGTSLRVPRATR